MILKWMGLKGKGKKKSLTFHVFLSAVGKENEDSGSKYVFTAWKTVYCVSLKKKKRQVFISGLSSRRWRAEPCSARCLRHEERSIRRVVGGSVEVF